MPHLSMNDQTNTPSLTDRKSHLSRVHFLVGITEKRLAIGRFGFREAGARGQTVVDVGNAKTEQEATGLAIARYSRKFGVNPILLNVEQVQKVGGPQETIWSSESEPEPIVFTAPQAETFSIGNLTLRVRND